MRFPLLVFATAVLSGVALAQQNQTPTTGAGATTVFKGGDFLPPESAFRKVVLDEDRTVNGELKDTLVDPMELAVAKDGTVFFAERKGVVKMIRPGAKDPTVIAEIPVFTGLEEGMLGITLDPKFEQNGWVYVNHSLPETTTDSRGKVGIIRVSRFTLKGDRLDPESRVTIYDNTVQREQCCHVGGSLAFDPQGNLYISVGDNTNPFDSDGYSPNDPRPDVTPGTPRVPPPTRMPPPARSSASLPRQKAATPSPPAISLCPARPKPSLRST